LKTLENLIQNLSLVLDEHMYNNDEIKIDKIMKSINRLKDIYRQKIAR